MLGGLEFTAVLGRLRSLAGYAGASLIGFIAAGAGAVARTLQAKLREDAITPEDFGAVGDNATDDKAALALCVTAAAGRSIRLTKKYKVSANGLSIPSTVGLIFEHGAQLNAAGGITITIDGPIQSQSGSNIFAGAGTIAVSYVSSGLAGINNCFYGAYAGVNTVPGAADEGTGNAAFGAQALKSNTTGFGNCAFGKNALITLTAGHFNTAFGTNALASMPTTGEQNCAFGTNALYHYVGTGNGGNTAIGTNTLLSNTTGTGNTAVGHNALDHFSLATTYTGCVAVGINAGNSNTASGIVAIGESTLFNNTGSGQVAVGQYVLIANTTGNQNTGVGSTALIANTTGSANTAVGAACLTTNTVGSGNSGLGEEALNVATGSNNTGVGYAAGSTATTGSNNFFVGYNSQPSAVGVSNEGTLGSNTLATLRCQVALTVVSDERDKTDLGKSVPGLAFVRKVKTMLFSWNKRDGSENQRGSFSGLSAQNLLELQKEFGELGLVHASNPEQLGATYERMIPVLVKAIQELSSDFEAYKAAHP